MRFADLASGSRFEFEGRLYTKTNALTASDENGKARVIPRSAAVLPIDGAMPKQASTNVQTFAADQVLAAIDDYHRRCLAILDELPEHERERWRQGLEEARKECLKGLS